MGTRFTCTPAAPPFAHRLPRASRPQSRTASPWGPDQWAAVPWAAQRAPAVKAQAEKERDRKGAGQRAGRRGAGSPDSEEEAARAPCGRSGRSCSLTPAPRPPAASPFRARAPTLVMEAAGPSPGGPPARPSGGSVDAPGRAAGGEARAGCSPVGRSGLRAAGTVTVTAALPPAPRAEGGKAGRGAPGGAGGGRDAGRAHLRHSPGRAQLGGQRA